MLLRTWVLSPGSMKQAKPEHVPALIERILEITNSPQSVPFYRKAIENLGEGIVEEECGELRYRMHTNGVNNPARYFTTLLQKRLSWAKGNLAAEASPEVGIGPVQEHECKMGKNGDIASTHAQPQEKQSYHTSSGGKLFTELEPITGKRALATEPGAMEFPYSSKTIPWATFIGPDFFTLSTNKARSDRVVARFRVLGGQVTEVPLIRGRLFPKDEERGILTAEEGRILGAMEWFWVDQGCKYARFGNGAVSCYCQVPIRRLAQLLGWESFGGRDLAHLKRKAINLKMKAYYLELDAVEELRKAGLKGYGFTLIDGFDLIDKTRNRLEETTFRVSFSDPYSRQLLARRVVSRPKDLLKMRSELAFVLRLYLEPILISRGIGREHSIELLNLIKVLNLPAAGWHRFKSRRKAIFAKAINELQETKTADGRRIHVEIRQGSNSVDFMLVGRLNSPSGPVAPAPM
jgi:hypothetical protein